MWVEVITIMPHSRKGELSNAQSIVKYVDKMAIRTDKVLGTQGLDSGGFEGINFLGIPNRGDLGDLTQEVNWY